MEKNKMKKIKIAVVGNQNTGKTTFINGIAGTSLHIGNWAGVTIEKKEAVFKYKDYEIKPVDQADLSKLEKLDDVETAENKPEEMTKEEKLRKASSSYTDEYIVNIDIDKKPPPPPPVPPKPVPPKEAWYKKFLKKIEKIGEHIKFIPRL